MCSIVRVWPQCWQAVGVTVTVYNSQRNWRILGGRYHLHHGVVNHSNGSCMKNQPENMLYWWSSELTLQLIMWACGLPSTPRVLSIDFPGIMVMKQLLLLSELITVSIIQAHACWFVVKCRHEKLYQLYGDKIRLVPRYVCSWQSSDKHIPPCTTVYPKKYAHGFVVLCFVVVMQSFIMNSHDVFIHIHQGCFAGTGAIVRLPQCQWSKPDRYGKISQSITTTKHSKAKTVCIFLGIYCT